MKNNLFRSEVTLSLLLVGLTLLFLNPFQKLWMPTMFMSLIVLAFILVFLLFAGLAWKEVAGDEREEQHRQFAGRISFLSGIGLLMIGIIYQSLQHALDPWLLVILCSMVIIKLFTRLYKEHIN